MPVLEATQAAEPKKLYEQQNHMAGKWPGAVRSATVLAIAIILIFLAAFVINPPALPHIQRASAPPRHGWAETIAVSIGLGVGMGLLVLVGVCIGVSRSRFEIYEDRLRVRPFLAWRDLKFDDIESVEAIRVESPFLPRAASLWSDLKQAVSIQLFTPHYMQVGHGQYLQRPAQLVLVRFKGGGWWQGYILDVDDAETFQKKLSEAVAARLRAA